MLKAIHSCNFDLDPIDFHGKTYQVRWWNGEDLPTEDFVSMDTETEMLIKGAPIKPVLLQVCYPKAQIIHLIRYSMWSFYLDAFFYYNPDTEIVFHNAPFDLKVLGARNNKKLWQCLVDGRITDTGIRFQLRKMEQGNFSLRWNLKLATKQLLNEDLDKNTDIRTTFTQDMPIYSEKCKDHVRYAAIDVIATALLRQILNKKYDVEDNMMKGAIVLDYISDNGIAVDMEHLIGQREHFSDLREKAAQVLSIYGIHASAIPEDKQKTPEDRFKLKLQTAHKKILQEYMQDYKQRYGLEFNVTEKSGNLILGADAENIFKDAYGKVPALIQNYNDYVHYNKMVSTYIPTKHIEASADGRIHSRYTNILKTGRTSSSGPNVFTF